MTTTAPEAHVLDNPVWHALHGPQSRFRSQRSTAQVVQFDPEVAAFSGVDRLDADSWRRLAEQGLCALVRDEVPGPPDGWEEQFRDRIVQMVAVDLAPASGLEVVRLGERDAPEMLALAEATEPGPFFLRTHELGRYVGVRRNDRLLAMAGERLRVPGYVETSGVCTHPDARGQGLASALTLDVAWSIRGGGNEAFLHVLESNEAALRLYGKLGFVVRRMLDVVVVQWNGAEGQ